MAEEFDWQARINIDSGILGGKPVIKGTRVPLETIVGALGAGHSVQEVCDDYGVEELDVRAALIYAAETLAVEVVHALPR